MKTITITIQVPDGVNVNVSQGAAQRSSGNGDDFVEREPSDPVTDECPIHGKEWELVAAGVSRKTGKRYNAFWTCPVRDCPAKPWETAESSLPF